MSRAKKAAWKGIEAPSGLLEVPLAITANGLSVLEKRYLQRNDEGKTVETVQQMFWRVASFVAEHTQLPAGADSSTAAVLELATKYYRVMSSLRFFPNSPTFTGAGTPLGQLAACFVLAIDDDMGKDSDEGIFSTLRSAALIQQTGGGVGFSFSRLRPKGDLVKTSHGSASGPISFIHVYDAAFGAIAQGGTRRGANMAVLRVDHPDIMEFIACKSKEGTLTNFNISVGLTDAFMQAVHDDCEYEIVNPHTHAVTRKMRATEVFNAIAKFAHRNGEPGVVFLDTANRANPVPHLYTLEATNPCGEQFLGPNESCCLGSINLAQFADAKKKTVDWAGLAETVQTVTRFLDDVIEANVFVPAVPALREAAKNVRRIGVGIMGLADMAYAMRVRYGSRPCLDLCAQVAEFIRYHAMATSIQLAAERGPFPGIKGSTYDPANMTWVPPTPLQAYETEFGRPQLDWASIVEGIRAHGIRNGAQTTVAPTGTIGTVAGCEGYGCEPVFALAYTRRVHERDGDVMLTYFSPQFLAAIDEAGITGEQRQRILDMVLQTGSCQAVTELPESIRDTFVVSGDVTVRDHVFMQASLQRFVDNSISKTVNFPPKATVDDVREAYLTAWHLGCKGLTIYVTGSRSEVVLETKATKEATTTASSTPAAAAPSSQRASPLRPAIKVTILPETTAAPTTTEAQQPLPPPPPPTTSTPPTEPEMSDEEESPTTVAIPPDTPTAATVVPPHETKDRTQSFSSTPFLKKRPRPDFLQGMTYRSETPLGDAFITVNNAEDGEPFEVFLNVGKGGSDVSAVSEALGRLVSLLLRLPSLLSPTDRLDQVVHQLEGIGGRKQKGFGKKRISSLPDAIARSLREHIAHFTGTRFNVRLQAAAAAAAPQPEQGRAVSSMTAAGTGTAVGSPMRLQQRAIGDLCPECGNSTLLNIEGCKKCHSCGYSEC